MKPRGATLTEGRDIAEWVAQVRAEDHFSVQPLSLSRSAAWSYADKAIRHVSGRFFSVIGLTWEEGYRRRWQPFIKQPEIGDLGFILRQGGDGPELLVHAKTEPGNVGAVQLAPTCQATHSNRDRVHGGDLPPYAAHFHAAGKRTVSESHQSEQGSRFAGKLNRNIVIEEEAEIADNQHRWIPFRIFRRLLCEDFRVNTDARSVLTTSMWHLLAGGEPFGGTDDFSQELSKSFLQPVRQAVIEELDASLQKLRTAASLTEEVALADMPGWTFDPTSADVVSGESLRVRHVRTHAESREVPEWDQPLIDSAGEQTVDLRVGLRNGVLHFGFRPCWEPGLLHGAELAPTSQSASPAKGERVLLAVRQSDEGGRFYQDVGCYRIIHSGHAEAAAGIFWLTLAEVYHLLPLGYFNNKSRSALSLLLSLL